jgi:ribosomal subunit interface protein
MPLRVSGKNIDIGDALRQRLTARVAEALDKYVDGRWSGHVTVEKEGTGFRTECALHLASGVTLEASGRGHDAYASADGAVEHIEKRLRRHKRRLDDRAKHRRNGNGAPAAAAEAEGVAASYIVTAPDHASEEEVGEFDAAVIAESTTALKRLSVSEAVVELDLTGAPVVVFRHAGHGRVNIVYRRRDGHVGWIDPPAGAVN